MKEVEIYYSKREKDMCHSTPSGIEQDVRECLSRKISGTMVGLWLLMPEHLRLGTWDLVKNWSGNVEIDSRLGLQLIHESCMCVSGVRPVRSLCHQGFELANGLPYIATDKAIHMLLDNHTVAQAHRLQIDLGKKREKRNHYTSRLFALDPHRIITFSRRVMPKKKKNRKDSAKKLIQTFFCIDAFTGQPLGCTIGSSGMTATTASIELLDFVKIICPTKSLIAADTEYYTTAFIDYLCNENQFDMLIAAYYTAKINKIIQQLSFKTMWAGYALAETPYKLDGSSNPVRLIVQRTGEKKDDYSYKAFIASGNGSALDLLTKKYPERWSIEDFFNFESALGWNKANTLNLNIKYGKLSLSLIAQATLYQLRQKLPKPYKNWTAQHVANSILHGIDGDIKVKNDTIIVTMYNVPESLNLKNQYENLPNILENEGVNPRIPWLYNFKLDFKFK